METENPLNQEEKLSDAQFRSLHKFFGDTAQHLQENGVTMSAILSKFILEVPATKNSVKEMWKILQEGMFGTNSTKLLLKKKEIDMIYDSLNKFLGETFEVSLPPWPSEDEQYREQHYGKILTP